MKLKPIISGLFAEFPRMAPFIFDIKEGVQGKKNLQYFKLH